MLESLVYNIGSDGCAPDEIRSYTYTKQDKLNPCKNLINSMRSLHWLNALRIDL